ncbi:MAG: hypothetical protein KatS3mg019_2363 [Fimbriimonadales bacterium]|nr:MAG: hypothetical protein KatS3mg019_2363 [Fimbriimonadales bacterium]
MGRQTQADAVEAALRKLGGFAQLDDLYKNVNVSRWGTQTPYATIRRILQKDPQKRFFKIRPGLWGLTALKQQILQKLALDQNATEEAIRQFDHTYYQGLILQIGKLRNYETFAPAADRNKLFLGTPLSSFISLKRMPPFTYPSIVKRAAHIDVIWFCKRGNDFLFPYAFFEVEHTTGFNNSLKRFVDFQDFNIRFYIVADAKRRRKFENCIESFAFDTIRERVQFIDYEFIVSLYERQKLASQVAL